VTNWQFDATNERSDLFRNETLAITEMFTSTAGRFNTIGQRLSATAERFIATTGQQDATN